MYRYIVLILTILYFADGYKILVYSPKYGISHVSFMGKIADILVKAGHEVVRKVSRSSERFGGFKGVVNHKGERKSKNFFSPCSDF
jgi:hypothetical protein